MSADTATDAPTVTGPPTESHPTGPGAAPAQVTVGIRPEGVDVVDAAGPDRMTVRLTRVEHMGSEIFAFADPVDLVPEASVRPEHLVIRLDKRQGVAEGRELVLDVHRSEVLLFGPDGLALR